MPSVHYGGSAFNIPRSELLELMEGAEKAANEGTYKWLVVDMANPKWLLVGPGIALRCDQRDDQTT